MDYKNKLKHMLHWLILAGSFSVAPICTRIVLLGDLNDSLRTIDWAGFTSDFAVCLICALVYVLLSKWSRILSTMFFFLWCLFHYSNYEHVLANSDIISVNYLDHLFDSTFLLGSGLAFSNILLLVLLLATPLAALVIKPVRLSVNSIVIVGLSLCLFSAAQYGFTSVPEQQELVSTARWRTHNAVQANVEDIFSAKLFSEALTTDPAAREKYQELLTPDLSGSPMVPLKYKNHNVLLVIIESVTGGFLNTVNKHHDIESEVKMPILDSISRANITYSNFIIHQRQTNRGMYSMLCGDYPKLNSTTPKMTEYITNSDAPCLPKILSEQGYKTAYLQAAPLPYMMKDLFTKKAGFSEIHGVEWFKDPYSTNYWGVDDKTFLEQASDLVLEQTRDKTPWFITLLSVGTHHPLNVPDSYDTRGDESEYQRSYRYTDEALGKFLRNLKKQGVLKNTLVIITTDESRGLCNTSLGVKNDKLHQQWGYLTVLHPDRKKLNITDRFAQYDVSTSIMDYLNIPDHSMMPKGGRSIFRNYSSDRDIYFGNTYRRIVGVFTKDNTLDICAEFFSKCRQYQLEPGKMFSANREKLGTLPSEARKNLMMFTSLSNGSISRPDNNKITFKFGSDLNHHIVPGPQRHLLAGQFFTLPGKAEISVTLKGTMTGPEESKIYMKHDLAKRSGKHRIVKFMYKTLKGNTSFQAQYDFYNYETFYGSEFRVTAELIKGISSNIVIEEATITCVHRPPTRDEHLEAAKAYDTNIGRDLNAYIRVAKISE